MRRAAPLVWLTLLSPAAASRPGTVFEAPGEEQGFFHDIGASIRDIFLPGAESHIPEVARTTALSELSRPAVLPDVRPASSVFAGVDATGHIINRANRTKRLEFAPEIKPGYCVSKKVYSHGKACTIPAIDTYGDPANTQWVANVGVPNGLKADNPDGHCYSVVFEFTFVSTPEKNDFTGSYVFRVELGAFDSAQLFLNGVGCAEQTCASPLIYAATLPAGNHAIKIVYGSTGQNGEVKFSYMGPGSDPDCFDEYPCGPPANTPAPTPAPVPPTPTPCGGTNQPACPTPTPTPVPTPCGGPDEPACPTPAPTPCSPGHPCHPKPTPTPTPTEPTPAPESVTEPPTPTPTLGREVPPLPRPTPAPTTCGTDVCMKYYGGSATACTLPNPLALPTAQVMPVTDMSCPVTANTHNVYLFESYLACSGGGVYHIHVDLDPASTSSASVWIDGQLMAQCTCCVTVVGSHVLNAGNHHMSVLMSGDGNNDKVTVSYQGADTGGKLMEVPCTAWAPGVKCCDTRPTTTTTPKPCPVALVAVHSGNLLEIEGSEAEEDHSHGRRKQREGQEQLDVEEDFF